MNTFISTFDVSISSIRPIDEIDKSNVEIMRSSVDICIRGNPHSSMELEGNRNTALIFAVFLGNQWEHAVLCGPYNTLHFELQRSSIYNKAVSHHFGFQTMRIPNQSRPESKCTGLYVKFGDNRSSSCKVASLLRNWRRRSVDIMDLRKSASRRYGPFYRCVSYWCSPVTSAWSRGPPNCT